MAAGVRRREIKKRRRLCNDAVGEVVYRRRLSSDFVKSPIVPIKEGFVIEDIILIVF